MTSKADFTEEEWERLGRAPLIAGMAISFADPGGPIEAIKESSAALKTLIEAANDAASGAFVQAVAKDVAEKAQRRENPLSGLQAGSPQRGPGHPRRAARRQRAAGREGCARTTRPTTGNGSRPQPSGQRWPRRRAASSGSGPSASASASSRCSTRSGRSSALRRLSHNRELGQGHAPNEVISATSMASRPRPTATRPMRGCCCERRTSASFRRGRPRTTLRSPSPRAGAARRSSGGSRRRSGRGCSALGRSDGEVRVVAADALAARKRRPPSSMGSTSQAGTRGGCGRSRPPPGRGSSPVRVRRSAPTPRCPVHPAGRTARQHVGEDSSGAPDRGLRSVGVDRVGRVGHGHLGLVDDARASGRQRDALAAVSVVVDVPVVAAVVCQTSPSSCTSCSAGARSA